MTDKIIEVRNVSKSYPLYHLYQMGMKSFILNLWENIKEIKKPEISVFKNISFEVKKGEAFGIIGRNGAGKSTLMGLILGILKPNSGEIVTRGKIAALMELGSGFHPELSGKENIFLNGIVLGMTHKEVAAKFEQIVEFSELGEFIEHPIKIYSSGMLARLGFAVISSIEPEILLVDEVLAVGDIAFQRKCYDRIKELKRNGTTIVFISHSPEDVKSLCDKALWIHEKEVKLQGESNEVVDAYVQFFSELSSDDQSFQISSN